MLKINRKSLSNKVQRMYLSITLLIYVMLNTFTLQSQIIDKSFTSGSSTFTFFNQKHEEVNSIEQKYSNLEIRFVKVNPEIGSGRILLLDNDRSKHYAFDIYLLKSKKLIDIEGTPVRSYILRADSGTSRVDIFLYFNTNRGEFLSLAIESDLSDGGTMIQLFMDLYSY